MSTARRAIASLAVVAVGISLLGSPAGADTKADLAAAKTKLDGLINQIAAENKAIGALESQIAAKDRAIEDKKTQIANTSAQIARLQGEIDIANAKLVEQQRLLDKRAWVAYENGPGTSFDFLLSSTSLSDLSDRLEIINHAAQSDQDLINQVNDQRKQLQAKQLQQRKLKQNLHDQELRLQGQQAELQVQLSAAQGAADQLNSDKAAADALVKKLTKKREAEIEAARLAAAAAAAAHAGSTAGAVGHPFSACPVAGAAYGDDFGAPRYSGGFHPHAGNDMFATYGTPIKAAFSGSAADSSNTLGGLSVTLSGAAGYVYNAHLSAFGTLGSVSAGTIIGYVGNSGDAQGGAPHDHFEWHPNAIPKNPHVSSYGYSVIGDAIDPYPYLNQVC